MLTFSFFQHTQAKQLFHFLHQIQLLLKRELFIFSTHPGETTVPLLTSDTTTPETSTTLSEPTGN